MLNNIPHFSTWKIQSDPDMYVLRIFSGLFGARIGECHHISQHFTVSHDSEYAYGYEVAIWSIPYIDIEFS